MTNLHNSFFPSPRSRSGSSCSLPFCFACATFFLPPRYATDWDWVWCITYFFVVHAQCITTLYLSLSSSFFLVQPYSLFPCCSLNLVGEGGIFFWAGVCFFVILLFCCVRRGEKKWCFFFTVLFCFVWLLGEGEGKGGRGEGRWKFWKEMKAGGGKIHERE